MGVITVSNVTTASSQTSATSYANIANIAINPFQLYLLGIASRTGISTDPNAPTASGQLTWTQLDTIVFDNTSSSRRRLTLFGGMSPTPISAGNVSIDFGGQTQTSFDAIFDLAAPVDTSGTNGAGAIGQTPQHNFDGSGTATSLSVTLSAFKNAANATYAIFGFGNASATATAGSGYSILANITDGPANTGDNRLTSEWRTDNNTSPSMSYSVGGEVGGIALELVIPISIQKIVKAMQAVNRLATY